MKNIIEFNKFLGEIIELSETIGKIDNPYIEFSDNGEEWRQRIQFDIITDKTCYSLLYNEYFDIDEYYINIEISEYDIYQQETYENVTIFDNKELMLSHLSTISTINSLFN